MQNFNELNLSPPVLRAISELGFETPSPIQAQALPLLLDEPTDFLGLAATGTGKTAAFAIPLIERIDPTQPGVQALILCPTRELAVQVSGQIDLIGKYKGIRSVPIYGGAGYSEQIRGLRQGLPVVVGTPGRVLDHMEKGTLVLEDLQTLVLDEADEMISMGFKEDIEAVLDDVPEGQGNIWLFSATMSKQVRSVADEYLNDPKEIQVNRKEMLPDTVQQSYFVTQESNKAEVLCKLIDAADDFYGIIFCQTKSLVQDLTGFLAGRGYRVDCLHGDMDQRGRERTMQAFRDRKVTVLVATDVACRGLDVKDITHVINYSIPRELDNYVHRIGRTGRSGKEGLAFSLVTNGFRGLIGRIEQMTKSRLSEGKIPTRKEIGIKKVAKQLPLLQAQTNHARAIELLDASWKTALEGMSKEEIAGRFLAILHPDVFAEREEPQKLNDSRPARVGGRFTRDRDERPRFERRPADTNADGSPFIVKPLGQPAEVKAVEPKLELNAKAIEALESESAAEGETVEAVKPAKKSFQKRGWEDRPAKTGGRFKTARDEARPAYGDRPAFGDRPAKRFGKPAFGDKPAYGDKPFKKSGFGKPAFGDKPAYGDKPFGAKPRSGWVKSKPRYEDSRPMAGWGKKQKPRKEGGDSPKPRGFSSY